MINGARVLAVIPARGGSKRCPRKNIKEFRGRSLIGWALLAASQSKFIDQTVLSSEDAEIKQCAVALEFALGLRATVLDRPPELATDTAANEDVMRHALSFYPDHEWVVLLQPCSPLRVAADIDRCIEMADEGHSTVISCRENGTKNGAVYVMSAALLQRGYNFSSNRLDVAWYWMPDDRSLDIDLPEDFDV